MGPCKQVVNNHVMHAKISFLIEVDSIVICLFLGVGVGQLVDSTILRFNDYYLEQQ
jgi:hypothetical protein